MAEKKADKNPVHFYVNKDGDRKIGKPELKDVFAKAGYTPEKEA